MIRNKRCIKSEYLNYTKRYRETPETSYHEVIFISINGMTWSFSFQISFLRCRILVWLKKFSFVTMSTSLINIIDWSSRFFEKRSTFQIRQGLENAFQNEEFVNTLLVVTFIVAYGMALQIAISLAFRKYLSYNFRKIKAVMSIGNWLHWYDICVLFYSGVHAYCQFPLNSVMYHLPFLFAAPESTDGKSMEEIIYCIS